MPVATDDEELLTGYQVAKILGRNPQTIRIYTRTGRIRSTKVGPHYRYKRAWVNEFIAKNETPSLEPAAKPSRSPRYAGK
jgi:excisionase family DNA binding protein